MHSTPRFSAKPMRVRTLLLTVAIATGAPLSAVLAASFSDVPQSHPQYAAVESLVNLGIVNGYEDGTFGPNNPVTRAEAVKMILGSADIGIEDVADAPGGFSDVPDDAWFRPFTAKAKQLGIVSGYGDTGEFQPGKQVTKAELIKILLQTFGTDLSKHNDMSQAISPDTAPGQWYLPQMRYAKTIGIISPDAAGNLAPNKQLSRAETADIIYKFLVIQRGGETQKNLSIAESNLVNLLVELNADRLEAAMQSADNAVFYTEQAMQASPDEGIVKAANKIAQGFQHLVRGYEAGVNNDAEALTQHVAEARRLAGEAFDDDNSTQPLGQKIKLQADILMQQVAETSQQEAGTQ